MKGVPKDGANGDGSSISSGQQVHQQVSHDDAVVDQVRVGLLGLDEVLEEVGNLGVKIGVLALKTGNEMLKRDAGDIAQVGGSDPHNRVLVEEKVQEGHLANGSKTGYCE